MYHTIEEIFKLVVQYSTMAMEMAGVLIVLLTAIRCLFDYLRGRKKLRIKLAEGISLALLFKMAAKSCAPSSSARGMSWRFSARSSCCAAH